MLKHNIIKEINERYSNNPVEERLCIAAAIQGEMKKFANEVTIVGGSAVEFYSAASYMTKDLDFIAKDTHNIKLVMSNLGFKNDNGIWYHDDTSVIIEFPKGPLIGDENKALNVKTPFGEVKLIGVEDIIIDRASAVKFWNDSSEWTEYLMLTHFDELDKQYLISQSKANLCYDIVKEIYEHVDELLKTHDNNIKAILEEKSKKYTPSEIEEKIIALLNKDKEPRQIIFLLGDDKKVKGDNSFERQNYIRKFFKKNSKIKHKVKEMEQGFEI